MSAAEALLLAIAITTRIQHSGSCAAKERHVYNINFNINTQNRIATVPQFTASDVSIPSGGHSNTSLALLRHIRCLPMNTTRHGNCVAMISTNVRALTLLTKSILLFCLKSHPMELSAHPLSANPSRCVVRDRKYRMRLGWDLALRGNTNKHRVWLVFPTCMQNKHTTRAAVALPSFCRPSACS